VYSKFQVYEQKRRLPDGIITEKASIAEDVSDAAEESAFIPYTLFSGSDESQIDFQILTCADNQVLQES
jgi:hypothetical protein